ncbi:putative serine/threonine-protein kinase PKH2 isoform X1 [Iris pallida]|uniref:Serine/threonine-protein kinase PKH2 isoform X1 n=1 Tax=Iris pallida TaxID=29817 RepID=A0AAX6F7R9_IRIPA|nr:putative serine/threonine-protein kinase PKH2 isoform X1 [Iris pallida]
MASSTPPEVQDVLDFLTAHGFSSAASALLDDVTSRVVSAPPPPPVRIPRSRAEEEEVEAGADSTSSSSSGDFVSMVSSPSDLLNPYGFWSPTRPKSNDSSERHSEFGTARDYNDFNIFGDSTWYSDQFVSEGYLKDPFFVPATSSFLSEDKYVMSMEAKEHFKEQQSDKPEMCSCSFPLCDCCGGKFAERDKTLSSGSAIYGRYQILDDETERLDECGDDGFQWKKDDCQKGILWKSNSLYEPYHIREKGSSEISSVEEIQVIVAYAADQSTFTNHDPSSGQKSNGRAMFSTNIDDEDMGNGGYNLQSPPTVNDGHEFGKLGTFDRECQDAGAVGDGGEDHDTDAELQLYSSHEDEYEIFELRIIHRKNRTGFEENKDLPIVLNSVIAGRYYITEYLGSAAFSKVVQAHDLQTGIDVCLKIIKNDKDFFDQSLDEIKLLKFVNKYDPADECHILRLYDYFYHQEHLFIVCELLRANLYEFQKYNQDNGEDVYFTLPRIQAIARQCLEALEYLHHLRIIHCDLKPENILIKSYSRCEVKVIDLGSSCFLTDSLCFYVQSRSYRAPEVILGCSYDEKIDIWSLGCILAELCTGDVLFPNESVVMMLARMIGILGPIDMEMLKKGQETPKYFTDDYDLYQKNEETDQVDYLILERSSLAHHLQANDAAFVDFVSTLLRINPKKRPTASQALQHRWLSFLYK